VQGFLFGTVYWSRGGHLLDAVSYRVAHGLYSSFGLSSLLFEYANTTGVFVPPTHPRFPESADTLPSKATHSIFSTNRVILSKKAKHMIAHTTSAEMGIEQHWILHQGEESSVIPYRNISTERNQLLKPH